MKPRKRLLGRKWWNIKNPSHINYLEANVVGLDVNKSCGYIKVSRGLKFEIVLPHMLLGFGRWVQSKQIIYALQDVGAPIPLTEDEAEA